MKTSTKFIIVALLFGIPAFLLGRIIWPDAPGVAMPAGMQLGLLMVISALEALAFGIGIGFILFGRTLLKNVSSGRGRGWAVLFWGIAWGLVSWWPHDNMHRANGEDLGGLIKIEYLFHFTLIAAAFLMARALWQILRDSQMQRNEQ